MDSILSFEAMIYLSLQRECVLSDSKPFAREMEQGSATWPGRRWEVLALLRGYREWRSCRTTRDLSDLRGRRPL